MFDRDGASSRRQVTLEQGVLEGTILKRAAKGLV